MEVFSGFGHKGLEMTGKRASAISALKEHLMATFWNHLFMVMVTASM